MEDQSGFTFNSLWPYALASGTMKAPAGWPLTTWDSWELASMHRPTCQSLCQHLLCQPHSAVTTPALVTWQPGSPPLPQGPLRSLKPPMASLP